MSKVIFKDAVNQALFDKQGFIVVTFIDDREIKELNEMFDILHSDISSHAGFVAGSYSSDFAYKKKASDEIVRIFSKHYERLFVNYQPFGAAFLYKMPDRKSQLGIHQDWTIVDEEEFVALNCWVPLCDIDQENGALHVVSGTQYDNIKTLRAPTLPFFFTGNEDIVERASIPMYVRAGQAVILNQSVIHYSPPNYSPRVRKAITAGIKSKGAPMIFHYKDQSKPESDIERFAMPEDFLISFENFASDISQRPRMGESTGFIKGEVDILGRDELIKLLQNGHSPTEDAVKPIGIMKRLKSLFTS